MKKNISLVIGIGAAIVIVGGGYAIFHKSPKTTPSTSTAATSSPAAVNNAVLATKTDATVGQYLADPSGKTLYTYGADSAGVSNCTGSCLASWPAYQDSGSTTNLPQGVSTIKRTDNGQVQYTYNGMPLYYFAHDSQGQVTGNGVSNFSVATPAAAASSQSTTTTPTSTTPSQSTDNSSSSNSYNY